MTVDIVEYLGPESFVFGHLQTSAGDLRFCARVFDDKIVAGTTVALEVPADCLHFFDTSGVRLEANA